ncbi:hypothetical protein BJF79_42715 [Actinomadura sp. CNU-125]|uniref:hypothetical protein n=1 Tax=Actinomadura sp. CNU-125 TaxID=1904961 RepID=UPI0009600059|nr:hypothetical protein [Actinomadura sp. CNU-125]OLT27144.1 hypothetical protein BJF79_42715 [Actinomadura sp. CNU-125]
MFGKAFVTNCRTAPAGGEDGRAGRRPSRRPPGRSAESVRTAGAARLREQRAQFGVLAADDAPHRPVGAVLLAHSHTLRAMIVTVRRTTRGGRRPRSTERR